MPTSSSAALDLLQGNTVRRKQGDFTQVTTYGDPERVLDSLDVPRGSRLQDMVATIRCVLSDFSVNVWYPAFLSDARRDRDSGVVHTMEQRAATHHGPSTM